jgi:hypothetical protein
MKNLIVKLICAVKGKSKVELALSFSFNYFKTRSRLKAYWLTIAL